MRPEILGKSRDSSQPQSTYRRVLDRDELNSKPRYYDKKIGEGVYLVKHTNLNYEVLVHLCNEDSAYHEMTFRENDDGPMYWCEGCGFVLGNGEAMAIRLYEAPF